MELSLTSMEQIRSSGHRARGPYCYPILWRRQALHSNLQYDVRKKYLELVLGAWWSRKDASTSKAFLHLRHHSLSLSPIIILEFDISVSPNKYLYSPIQSSSFLLPYRYSPHHYYTPSSKFIRGIYHLLLYMPCSVPHALLCSRL